jgi:hypothetical protein
MVFTHGQMILSALRWLTGWSELPKELPQRDTLFVFSHTSYFDLFVLGLYMDRLANLWTLVRPLQWAKNLSEHLTHWAYKSLHFIEAGSLHEHKSGTTQYIVSKLKEAKRERPHEPLYFLMSPKGTVQKAPWRSGWSHIAKALELDVRAIILDYEQRSIGLSGTCTTEQELKDALALGLPLRPHNSDLDGPVKDHDAYELLSFVDLPTVSMMSAVPAVYKAWASGLLAPALLSTISTVTSFAYHHSRETEFAGLDAAVATANILIGYIMAPNKSTWAHIFMALALSSYYAGTPRVAFTEPKRGPYVVYHTCFHVFASIAAYLLYDV